MTATLLALHRARGRATAAEVHAVSYWRACQALRNPRLAPADRAQVVDTLYDLATSDTGRVRELAARTVWPDYDGGAAA